MSDSTCITAKHITQMRSRSGEGRCSWCLHKREPGSRFVGKGRAVEEIRPCLAAEGRYPHNSITRRRIGRRFSIWGSIHLGQHPDTHYKCTCRECPPSRVFLFTCVHIKTCRRTPIPSLETEPVSLFHARRRVFLRLLWSLLFGRETAYCRRERR